MKAIDRCEQMEQIGEKAEAEYPDVAKVLYCMAGLVLRAKHLEGNQKHLAELSRFAGNIALHEVLKGVADA